MRRTRLTPALQDVVELASSLRELMLTEHTCGAEPEGFTVGGKARHEAKPPGPRRRGFITAPSATSSGQPRPLPVPAALAPPAMITHHP
jgi:hypothetical protein